MEVPEPQTIAPEVVVPKAGPTPDDPKISLHEEKQALRERHEQDIEDRKTARAQRQRYAQWVFLLVLGWITAIFALLLMQSLLPIWVPSFKPLSDKVLLALITSTTVDLIGTLIVVLRYIFHVPDSH